MGNIIQKLGFMGYLMETGPNRYMIVPMSTVQVQINCRTRNR